MASGLGPVVSVVLFAFLGNRWEVRNSHWLVMAGQVLASFYHQPTQVQSMQNVLLLLCISDWITRLWANGNSRHKIV